MSVEDNEPKVRGRRGKSTKTTGSWRAVGESCGSNRWQSRLGVGGGGRGTSCSIKDGGRVSDGVCLAFPASS